MLDAYGRIPKGMAQGNSVDPGMFDQCLNIAVELDDVAIKGRYCYAGLMLPLIDINLNTSQVDQVVNILFFMLSVFCLILESDCF